MNDIAYPFKILLVLITVAVTFVTYITINTNIYIDEDITEPLDIIDVELDDISYDINFAIYTSFRNGNDYYLIDFNKNLVRVDKATYERANRKS